MDVLRIYSLEDYQSLIPGLWGIREPSREYDGNPRLNGGLICLSTLPTLTNASYSSGYRERGNRPCADARLDFDRRDTCPFTHS
jgi:hypothetical protein